MARRSSRGSVYNKRSNERVQAAQTSSSSSGINIVLPVAHAQSASNPTQNRTPQANPQQQDPWARATQFVHNVGRGGYDVGRSYTTDIADTAHAIATGKEQEERSYRDETLATVFGRGLFEGNLEGSFAEASRRVQEQPGRVVGEVAAETAIMIGSMGFGAVLKGAKIGATGIKATQGGVTSFTSKTGFGGANLFDTGKATLRAGSQEKTIGSKITTTVSTRGGKTKTKIKKTGVLDKLEHAGTSVGVKQGAWTKKNIPWLADKFKMGRAVGEGTNIPIVKGASGLPPSSIDNIADNTFSFLSSSNIASANIAKTVAAPAVKKGSNVFSGMSPAELVAGKLLQDQQFEAGKLAHVSGITKQSGLFEGVPAPGFGDSLGASSYMLKPGMQGPVQPAVRGTLDFTQPTRIGGMGDNFSNLKTSTLDSEDIATHGREYIDRDTGTWKTDGFDNIITYGTRTKLKPEEEVVAQGLIKEMTKKIMANKGIAAARERPKKVFMKDDRGDLDYSEMQKMVGNDTPADMLGGSPSSIMYDKANAIDSMTDEVYRVLSQQSSAGVGTLAQAKTGALKVIKHYEAENVIYNTQVAKESASVGSYMSIPGMQGPPGPTTSQLGVLGSATPNANDALQKMVSFNINAKKPYDGIESIGSRLQDGADITGANYMAGRGAEIKSVLPKGLLVESDMSGGINSIGQQRLDRFGGKIADKGDGTVANNYSEATKELVGASDGVIAFFEGTPGIGTTLALDTAKKKGIPTISNPTATQLSEWAELGLIRNPAIVGTRGSKITKPKALKPGMQGPVQQSFEDRMKSSLAGLAISKSDNSVAEVSGMVYGPYGKPDAKRPFDAATSEIWHAGGGVPDDGVAKVGKDMLNDGPVSNMYTTPGDLLALTNRGGDLITDRALIMRGVKEGDEPIFSASQAVTYKGIREAKTALGDTRARTPDEARMAMPDTLEGYTLKNKFTIQETKNMLFTFGQGGTNMDVYSQLGLSQNNLRPFNALWEAGKQGPLKDTARYGKGAVFDGIEMTAGTTPAVNVQSPWLLRPVTPVKPQQRITPDMLGSAITDVKSRNQQSFIEGDISVLGKTKWTGDVDDIPNLTKSQIKEAIPTKQFAIDEAERLTDPVEDLDSLLSAIRFDQGGPPPTMSASNFWMGKPKQFKAGDYLGMNDQSWMKKAPKGATPNKTGALYKKAEALKKARNDRNKPQTLNNEGLMNWQAKNLAKDDFVRTATEEGTTYSTKKKNQPKTSQGLWSMFGKMGQPTGGGNTTRVGGGPVIKGKRRSMGRTFGSTGSSLTPRPVAFGPVDSRPFQSNPTSYGWGVDFGSNSWGSGSGVPAGTKTSPTQVPLGGNNARVPPSQNFSPRPNWTEPGWDKLGPIPQRTANESKKDYTARMRSLGYLPRS